MASGSTAFVDQTSKDIEPFVQGVISALVEASKSATAFPDDSEYQYLATFPGFRSSMAEFSKKVLGLGQRLVESKTADAEDDIPQLSSLSDVNDADEEYERVADVIDVLMERVVRFVWGHRAVDFVGLPVRKARSFSTISHVVGHLSKPCNTFSPSTR